MGLLEAWWLCYWREIGRRDVGDLRERNHGEEDNTVKRGARGTEEEEDLGPLRGAAAAHFSDAASPLGAAA